MNSIKSFTQGVFEILLPGSFLLLNLGIFLIIAADIDFTNLISGSEKWGIAEAIPMLGASYILGMVLRMLRTEIPDRISAWCLGHLPPRLPARSALKERFFYVKWMRQRYIPCLPEPARHFFEDVWEKHYQDPIGGTGNPNTHFFNFMKTLLLAIHKETSDQIMASEAISRFVASSFWALVLCTSLIALDGGVLFEQGKRGSVVFNFCVLLFFIYLAALYGIIRHFRYLRCKEVAFVFDASFAHRIEIEKRIKSQDST